MLMERKLVTMSPDHWKGLISTKRVSGVKKKKNVGNVGNINLYNNYSCSDCM